MGELLSETAFWTLNVPPSLLVPFTSWYAWQDIVLASAPLALTTCRLVVVLTSLLLSVPTGMLKFAGAALAEGIDLMVTVALCAAAAERLANTAKADKNDFMVGVVVERDKRIVRVSTLR